MSMFNDISCDGKGNEEEYVANSKVVSILAKKFGIGQWSFIGPGSEKKWYSMEENSPQGIWDHIADKMLLQFAESGCPIFRATTPLSRGNLKSKGHGKLSDTFYCGLSNNRDCFSHNCFCQLKEEIAAEPRAPLVSSPSQFPPTCVGCGDGGSPSQARHSRGRVECPEFGPRREVEEVDVHRGPSEPPFAGGFCPHVRWMADRQADIRDATMAGKAHEVARLCQVMGSAATDWSTVTVTPSMVSNTVR